MTPRMSISTGRCRTRAIALISSAPPTSRAARSSNVVRGMARLWLRLGDGGKPVRCPEPEDAPAWRSWPLARLETLPEKERRALVKAGLLTLGDVADEHELFGGGNVTHDFRKGHVSRTAWGRAAKAIESFVAAQASPGLSAAARRDPPGARYLTRPRRRPIARRPSGRWADRRSSARRPAAGRKRRRERRSGSSRGRGRPVPRRFAAGPTDAARRGRSTLVSVSAGTDPMTPCSTSPAARTSRPGTRGRGRSERGRSPTTRCSAARRRPAAMSRGRAPPGRRTRSAARSG